MKKPAPVVFLFDVDNSLFDNDWGNVHKLKELPPRCRAGDNANALRGGFRWWEKTGKPKTSMHPRRRQLRTDE